MVGLLAASLLAVAPSGPRAAVPPSAPGYGPLQYSLPEPGTYALPALGPAADGEVLGADGRSQRLYEVYGDKIVLLSFMYSGCTDANGCPLSAYVFYKIKSQMAEDPVLADRLALVSLSFDPDRDTPDVLQLYGANFAYAGNAGQWRFLTTRSEQTLAPILEDYGQDIQRQISMQEADGGISHVLRVFLIDARRRIRNIYSVSFLHPALVLADVRTLIMEEDPQLQAPDSAGKDPPRPPPARPADEGPGSGTQGHAARGLPVASPHGDAADLLEIAQHPPLGLPPIPVPSASPMTRARVQLGRKLFFDRRLSFNDTISCAMCHVPEQGFTSHELQTAVGIEGRTVRRNSPTLYNIAYAQTLFHDGREENLEQQVWGPLLARNEMGNPSVGAVLSKIRTMADYHGRFEEAFEGRAPSMETLGMAIASYERTLLSANSPFDRWYYGRENGALSESAQRGLALFRGKAGCSACHTVGDRHALFTDHRWHDTGLGFRDAMGTGEARRRVRLAPGVFVEVDRELIETVESPRGADVGRYEVTQDPADRWKYKTPSLRNIALTAPYMHNGALGTLEAVIRFYNGGGVPHPGLDPRIRRLDLEEAEIRDLLAFLNSLTGDNVGLIVADALSAPVGDVTWEDPHWANSPPQGP